MSLFSLPVTSADIVALQQGILFTTTNAADINNQVSSINAPGTTETVASYANQLLASVQATSQMAMGVSALETGANQTVAVLTNLVTNPGVIPAYLNFAAARGLDAGQVVGESLGLAFSGAPGFAALAGLSTGAFAAAVSGTFGINQSFLVSQVQFFVNLYTGTSPFPGNPNPTAAQIQSAANGAVFGLAVALNIEGVSTPPSIAVTTQTQVKNALFDIAQSGESPPGQKYVPGLPLPSHPVPTPFQSGPNVTGVFLTQGADTPTSGFATDANGTPKVPAGFTATVAGTVFNALPFVTSLGLANNTLNTGDDLEATGAAAGATTLNLTTTSFLTPANPSFAQGITMNGVNTLNITNNSTNAASPIGGFAGTVKGLLVETNTNSVNPVTLGATGQGLGTLLTNINITGYAGLPGSDINTVILAAGVADLTKTINVALTGGNLGTTAADAAQEIAIASDAGTGTAAAPNNTYGTWALTINNNANLQLEQSVTTDGLGKIATEGGVGGATTLSLAGKGNVGLGQAVVGDWQKVVTINAGGESGNVIIPGATTALQPGGTAANALYNSLSSAANPFWLFGSDFGLLDDTGAAFNLKEYDLGSGLNVLDVSTATAAQIAALKTVANATPSKGNFIIVQNAVATTTTTDTFKNIAGFDTLGIGGATPAQGANGTINMANLPAAITTIDYFTPAAGSVKITNQTAALTVNVFDQTTAAQSLTVGGPAGLTDSLTVIAGNPNHNGTIEGVTSKGGDALGDINVNGDEVFTLTANGGGNVAGAITSAAAVANGAVDVGGTIFVPTLGGNEQVTISGNTTLQMAITHSAFGALQDQTAAGILNANNLSVTLTNSAATEWGQALAGPLVFANGGPIAPVVNYSNNAVKIDASTSGGLINPWGDANFVGNQGDTIIGAANPVGHASAFGTPGGLLLGDVFGGSPGNDILTSKSMTLPDYIVTQGGADTITLAAGHTGADHIGFYDANGGVNVGGLFAVASVAGSIMEPGGGGFDFANPGWFGIASNGSSTRVDDGAGLFPAGGGTSGSQSTVNGFTPGQDVLDFSGQAWAFTGVFTLGLVADTAGGLQNVNAVAGDTSPTGAPVHATQVAPGGNITATGTDLIVLSQGSFLNAAAVAGALGAGGSYNIMHSALLGSVEADFLLAYAGLDGNTHIADLHLAGNVAVSTHTNTDLVTVSDMANLVGVNLTAFAAAAAGSVHLIV